MDDVKPAASSQQPEEESRGARWLGLRWNLTPKDESPASGARNATRGKTTQRQHRRTRDVGRDVERDNHDTYTPRNGASLPNNKHVRKRGTLSVLRAFKL